MILTPAWADPPANNDNMAAYCLGRAEFSKQAAEGWLYAAKSTASPQDVAFAAKLKKRANALATYLNRKGIPANDPSAQQAHGKGEGDARDCSLAKMSEQQNKTCGSACSDLDAACKYQAACDDLADSLEP